MTQPLRKRIADGHNQRAGSAELALRKHNLTGTDLQKLAQAAVNQALRNMHPPPPLDPHEKEDLTSYVTEQGLKWAIVYNPTLDAHGNFATSVYSRMRLRVIDWCRTNIHDPRFGTNKRHTTIDPNEWEHPLTNDHETIEPPRPRANPTTPWADTWGDAFTEPDFQDNTISRINTNRYQQAAERQGITITEWILRTLDDAA